MLSTATNRLCGPCQRIIETVRVVDWYRNLIHHESLETLRDSAQETCGICTVLLQHLQSSDLQQVHDLWNRLFPIKCESDTSSASWQNSFKLVLTSDGVRELDLEFTFEGIKESIGWYTPMP
jgi:hypothetical protein